MRHPLRDDFLRAVPQPVQWSDFFDPAVWRLDPLHSVMYSLPRPQECVQCAGRVFNVLLRCDPAAATLQLRAVNTYLPCHPDVTVGQVTNAGYLLDLALNRPMANVGQGSGYWWRGNDLPGWMPIAVRSVPTALTTTHHVVLAPLDWYNQPDPHAGTEAFHLAGLFLDYGFMPPLSLCTPEALPHIPELNDRRWLRRTRYILRGMKASLKHTKAQFQIMNTHLSALLHDSCHPPVAV